MPGLDVSQLSGLVTLTLEKYGKGKVTDIAANIQDYVCMSKLLPKYKESLDGGKSFKFNLATAYGDNARHTGLFAVDNVDVTDAVIQGEVPWRFTEVAYSYDLREEAINDAREERIVNHIVLRREEEMGGLAELMEETFWGKPTSSADVTTPFGIDYWVVTNATTGFNGGNPSGFTSGAAGIDQGTYGNWANYTAQYTNVTKADLIDKMKTAKRKIQFKSPMKHPSYDTSGTSDNYQLYTSESVCKGFENIGEAQNENLGKDVDSMFGMITFQQSPVVYVPYLDDNDANDKVYMINWNVMDIMVLKDWYLKRDVVTSGSQHNVVKVFEDLVWNTCCKDRRKQAVFAIA